MDGNDTIMAFDTFDMPLSLFVAAITLQSNVELVHDLGLRYLSNRT